VVHDTEMMPREFPPEGVGVACADQELPCHISASSPAGPKPVASQNLPETHDTELSEVNPAAADWADQEVPFHTSVSAPPPTASQKLAEAHDTELRFAAPGTACAVQEVPFHLIAPAPGAAALKPTASQKCVEVQDTPDRPARSPLTAWAGLGVAWIFQEVPFHTSARPTKLPEPSRCVPTASQKVAETHDTAVSRLRVAPAGCDGC